MKKLFLTTSLCMFIFNWTWVRQISANDSIKTSNVLELKRQGWEVIETQNSVESRPGLKPYENLNREVQVVKYRLREGARFSFCLVEYDSQLDTIRESCSNSEEKAREQLGQ